MVGLQAATLQEQCSRGVKSLPHSNTLALRFAKRSFVVTVTPMVSFVTDATARTDSFLPDTPLLDAYSEAVSSTVTNAGAAVIHLEVRSRRARTTEESGGSGSGFFLSPDGYALTNSHVVHGATDLFAHLADGRRLRADLVGEDLARPREPARGASC